MVRSIDVCYYFFYFGSVDIIPGFLSVVPFFPESQKVIEVGKYAFPNHSSNQLCACTLLTKYLIFRGRHGIQEAKAGFLDQQCTYSSDDG